MNDDGLTRIDRRALASVAMQFFVNGLVFASFVPRLPEIRDSIDIGNDELGRLLAIGALSGVLGSLAVGRLVEKFGTRRLLIGAGIVLCSSLSIVGVAAVPLVLVVALASMSICDVLVDTSMNLQGSWISGRRRVPVMNRLHGLWSLGTVIGGVAAAQAASLGVSLRVHLFVVSGILVTVVLIVGTGLLRVDEATSTDEQVGEPGGDAMGRSASIARRSAWRPLMLLAVVSGCSIAMEMTSSDWAAIRLTDDLAASAGVAGLGYVAFTAGMTTGRFGGDSMIARFGHQRVADVGIAMSGVGLAIASFAPVSGVVMIGYLVAGLGIATQFPKLYDDAAKHPGRPGAGLGALTGGSRIALLVTPVIIGELAATDLSVGAATAALTLPAAFGFFLLTRRRPAT